LGARVGDKARTLCSVNNDSADKPNDEERDPIDDVMDLLVFAPIGLALELRNLLPGLAERGRRQVNFARSVGQMATNSAKSASQPPQPKKAAPESATSKKAAPKAAAKEEPDKAKMKAGPKKATAKKKAAPKAAAEKPSSKKKAAPKTGTKKTGTKRTGTTKTAARKDPAKKAAARKTPATKAAAEPVAVRPLREIIQNYDSMSARDIIGSLGQLTETDLEVIRTYEAANRGRVTVLNRVNQMLKA